MVEALQIEAQIAPANPAHSKQPEPMSKVAQREAELETLSQAELRQIRGLLDDLIEDELEFTPEFESAIQQSEREKTSGIRPRMRQRFQEPNMILIILKSQNRPGFIQ